MKFVSIIVIAYNEEKCISDCIKAILRQTHPYFELIIVNDGSTDQTEDITKRFKDNRIIYTKHHKNKGYASARNTGIRIAKGEFIFFTDADCRPNKYWVEQGLKFMEKNPNLVAASGTSYLHPAFEKDKSIRDVASYKMGIVQSLYYYPGTLNAVYKTKALHEVGCFNELYNLGLEDADLGFRILKIGKVRRCENMIVFHQPEKMNLKRGLTMLKRRCQNIYLIKHHSKDFPKLKKSKLCYYFIFSPYYLLPLFFPPLIFLALKEKNMKINSFKDLAFLVLFYFSLWYQRFMIWKTAFKARIFLI